MMMMMTMTNAGPKAPTRQRERSNLAFYRNQVWDSVLVFGFGPLDTIRQRADRMDEWMNAQLNERLVAELFSWPAIHHAVLGTGWPTPLNEWKRRLRHFPFASPFPDDSCDSPSPSPRRVISQPQTMPIWADTPSNMARIKYSHKIGREACTMGHAFGAPFNCGARFASVFKRLNLHLHTHCLRSMNGKLNAQWSSWLCMSL